MTTSDEKWVPVFGFDGIYEVSSIGRIRRISRASGATKGAFIAITANRIGYPTAYLRKDGKNYRKLVHRIVLEAFTKERDETVNHKNGIKTDNRLENLEWCSRQANLLHACQVLGKRRGTNHWKAKLNDVAIAEIRGMVKAGTSHREAAEKFGVSRISVTYIIARKTWKHVP